MERRISMSKTTFKKDGTIHTLIKISGVIELYELRYEEGGTVVGYSVMRRVRKALPFDTSGATYMALPSSSFWGIHGWSYYTLCGALDRFGKLLV
jgi:hypothetical protein